MKNPLTRLPLAILIVGISLLLVSCSGGTDYWEWAKEFFKGLEWYEWIIFILLIVFIILVILALAGVEWAVAVVAAIIKAFIFILELVWAVLRALYYLIRALLELLIDGLKWLLGWLRGWIGRGLAWLLERFPWLRTLWELVSGNAVWDLIKESAGWIRWLIIAIINFIAWLLGVGQLPGAMLTIPCGQSMQTPPLRKTAKVTVRDYPFGKSGAEIRQEAIDEAEKEVQRSLKEDLEKLATLFQCAPGCTPSITVSITLIPPTTVSVGYYGLFDSYEATATAQGFVTIRCQ